LGLEHIPERIKNRTGVDLTDDIVISVSKELLHWFKYDFFTWISFTPKCEICESPAEPDESLKSLSSDSEDISRIEQYICPQKHVTKFTRYIRYEK